MVRVVSQSVPLPLSLLFALFQVSHEGDHVGEESVLPGSFFATSQIVKAFVEAGIAFEVINRRQVLTWCYFHEATLELCQLI